MFEHTMFPSADVTATPPQLQEQPSTVSVFIHPEVEGYMRRERMIWVAENGCTLRLVVCIGQQVIHLLHCHAIICRR